MDFRLDEDQQAVRDAVRAFCAERFGLERVTGREDAPVDASTWEGVAGLGVLGMLDEGSAVGIVEATVVFEELGAHLAGGPLRWTTLAASLVPGAADGAVRVTGIEVEPWTAGPVVVPHAGESDVLLVVRDEGVECCAPAELEVTPGSSIDPLTPVGVLAAVPAGELVAGPDTVADLRRTGSILAAAELVGGAQAVLDVAVAYALERRQFGVAIGSFQAVKHLLADSYVRVEMARAATYAAAALAAGRGEGDVDHAAGAAKHLAGDAGVANARTGVQVLGGMGFTWDMLPHLFLKRALLLDRSFGTADAHAARLGDAVGAEVSSS